MTVCGAGALCDRVGLGKPGVRFAPELLTKLEGRGPAGNPGLAVFLDRFLAAYPDDATEEEKAFIRAIAERNKTVQGENVSWEDAQKFIQRLNQAEGEHVYRLPTEAEWEYACRARTTTPFYTGRCLGTDEANYDGNYPLKGCPKGVYREKTTPVGSFPPNPFGLYDMHGNVSECCQDRYGPYPKSASVDPGGPSTGTNRVLRGGSWGDAAWRCRSSGRDWDGPGNRDAYGGFRLAFPAGQ